MEFDIEHGPAFALLKVRLRPGERITAEAGAMVSRDVHVGMRTRLNASGRGFFGSILAFIVALFRRIFGGEPIFFNEFSSADGEGVVTLAPAVVGQISHHRLENQRILVQPGSFLAMAGDVGLRIRWGGLRGLLSKEGLFFLELYGTGDVFLTAYGGIHPVPVDGTFIVDNGHIVAFEGTLDFRIRTAGGGLLGLVASGEGLVCRFDGRGTVWIQSRNPRSLASWVLRLLPS